MSKIISTGSCVPDAVHTNADLHSANPEWVEKTLGIRERRFCKDETIVSLATSAARRALEGIDKSTIDLLILATASPAKRAPSTASLVAQELGIACAAFDMNAVCSGFLYALHVGDSLMKTAQYRKALIIGADVFSDAINWSRRDNVFFGDGAGAVILNNDRGIERINLYGDSTHGTGFTLEHGDYFEMDGKSVYEAATTVLPKAIQRVLKDTGIDKKAVKWIIPHQPSMQVLKKTAELVGIPFEKVKTNMIRYANTSSATIPLLLDEVNRAGELLEGDIIVLAAVGSGWTWGAGVMRW